MKKEVSGKKSKWLWLSLGLVVLLAIAGVVLALVLGGGNDEATVAGRPDLYWNVDKEDNVDPDTGLSTRQPAEDGNYYIRFAYDGEQVEIPVADKKLVNYIDTLDLMSLTLDDNGFAVDVHLPKEVATIVGERLYVQSVDANNLVANSSITMNGRKLTVKLPEDLAIYNVSGKGEFVGESIDVDELSTMDSVSIYGMLVPEGSDEEAVVTHIFVTNKPAESPVYWRANKFYKSKKTTRVPDENGDYTIPFYCDGEYVQLKCKDESLVTEIDSVKKAYCHFGLELDEEGYIVDILDSAIASRTLLQCEQFDITAISEDGSYTATSIIKNNGATVEGVLGEDCVIYDVSSAAKGEHQDNRRLDSLQLGDRVCIWTDTLGKPVLIYVAVRLVDSPAYWNVSRQYDSTTKTSTREPNANGYYEAQLLKAGDTEKRTYYFKTLEDVTALDNKTDRCVGLKVGEGNVVEYVYSMECVFGNSYFCQNYFVTEASPVVCTVQSSSGSGYTLNAVVSPDCKIWNVSTYGKYGEATTLQVGDTIYACKNPAGEIINAYVTRRTLGVDTMYWRLSSQKYDSTNKVTTRTPNEEGYYVYKFAHMGKQVILKTKDKKIANSIDSRSTPNMSLIVKDGIIQSYHSRTYAVGGIYREGYYVKDFTDSAVTIYSSSSKKEQTWNFAENVQIYNVSNSFKEFKGEKTKLQPNDYVYVYCDVYTNVQIIYVWGRETSNIAWPVAPQYDSSYADTLRVPDADGWYYVDLLVNGQIKTYKTKNKEIMNSIDGYNTAFGIETSGDVITYYSTVKYVENVKGSGVSNYTVTSISGKNVTTMKTLGASTLGTTKSVTLTSKTKIYDVSGSAKKMGELTKLQVGDKVYTYDGDDGNALYIFVVARGNRAGGYMSLCDHCNKVVYWNPYHASANVTATDCHYYLASDVTIFAQMRVYSETADFETVLDLNGHTLTRDGGRAVLVRYGDTLTVIDSVGGGKIETSGVCSAGTVLMVSRGTLNLYGGALSRINGENSDERTYAGGLLQCANGTVNMYGGTLANGEAFANKSDDARGGAIRLTSSTFNMYGGLITGGKAHDFTYTTSSGTEKTKNAYGGNIYAKESTINISGGIIENGEADGRGGNIFLASKSTVNITGGKIAGGVVHDRGGNIYNSASTVNISGGEIVDGLTTNRLGGNIMATGRTGYVNISGGKITGGTGNASNAAGGNICLMYSNVLVTGGEISGGNSSIGANIAAYEYEGKGSSVTIANGVIKNAENSIYVSSARSNVTITGGTLEGLTNINRIGNFTISGKPVIKNLKLGETVLLSVDKMEQGADITVNKNGVFTKPNAAAYAQYFKPYDSELLIGTTDDGALKVHHPDSTGEYCPHCEGETEWMPWDGVTVESGHYFLQDDITLEGRVQIKSGTNVILDLRGKTVTAAENKRAFYVLGSLSVIDSVGGGSITGGRAVDSAGGNVYVDHGVFNLYSGAITNGVSDSGYGGNVYATSGEINIMGGKVLGGSGKYGANVCANYSKLNISGGEIIGSDTEAVPNVSAKGSSGKLAYVNITGGKLTGSVNNFSVSSSYAEVSISGGELDGLSIISKVAKLDVSGKPVIENLQLGDTTVMTVGEMEEGTSIVINKVGTFTSAFASQTAAEEMLNSGYFAPYNAGESLGITDAFELEVISSTGNPGDGEGEGSEQGSCPHCEGAVWTEWDGSTVTSGHYYLTAQKDITEAQLEVVSGTDVVIDLRGNTITATDVRAFRVKGQLSIVDTVGGGKVIGTGVANDDHANGGLFYVSGGGILNLYSGELSMADENHGAMRGGVILVSTNSTFNMYGGAVRNGVADGDPSSSSSLDRNGRGGNICNQGGTLNLEGGVIDGGKAGNGGNINNCANDISTVNISGTVVISNGTAVNGNGGNLYVEKGILNISGGTMTGGKASNLGDNIRMSKSDEIADLTITGGVLEGVTSLGTLTKFALSGNPVIENLRFAQSTVITELGTLTEGASIGVSKVSTATEYIFTQELTNAADVVCFFSAADADKIVLVAENKLTLGEACPCGCKTPIEDVQWLDANAYFQEISQLAENNGLIAESVHLRLSDDLDITALYNGTKQIDIGNDTTNVNVVIDLNGKTWSSNHRIRIIEGSTLTVLDSSAEGTGVMTSTGKGSTTHGGVFINYGTLNIYSGTFTQPAGQSKVSKGGIIYQSEGVFNLYGGTLTGGQAVASSEDAATGGNVHINTGVFNMYGGTISGGIAQSDVTDQGGNAYIFRSATFNIYGGTITGGTADQGGDVYLSIRTKTNVGAELNMAGGEITGQVYVPSALAVVNVSGATVLGNVTLMEDAIVSVGDLFSSALIAINKTTEFTDVLANAERYLPNFTGVGESDTVVVTPEGKLIVVAG